MSDGSLGSLWTLVAIALLGACSDRPAPEATSNPPELAPPAREATAPAPTPSPTPSPSVASSTPPPAVDSDTAPPALPAAASPVASVAPAAPARGCAFAAPTRAHAGEWSALAAGSQGFLLAGTEHAGDAERAFVLAVGLDGRAQTLAEGGLDRPVPAEHRRAGPVLAAGSGRVALALVDGERRVRLAELSERGANQELRFAVVGEGASLRFTPALARVGSGWAIAWTSERDDTLRVYGVQVADGASSASGARELRSLGGGAAAPTFVAGASAPTLLMLEPRAGMSAILRVPVSGAGFGEPSVARPVSLITEPPSLVAARVGANDWAAYTAIGSAATTAVGLLRLDDTAAPAALVPGTGYGVLHVATASLPTGLAVFVADAPQGPAPTAPREVVVRALGPEGVMSDPIVLRGSSGAASRGRVASVASGVVAVSFTDTDAVHVALGRCAPP